MRVRSICLTVAIATGIAVAGSAVAAKNPSSLILLRKDFPAHADYEAGPGVEGFNLEAAFEAKNFDAALAGYYGATYSAQKGHLQIRGAIITNSSPARAKTAFTIALKARQAFWKQLGEHYKPMSGLPSFGDQQLAFVQKPTVLTNGAIEIVVRKRSVVWVLQVLIDRQPPASVSAIVANVKTYATKQKGRIGPG